MNQFEKYKLVWKIWTSLKKFELEINLNHNSYIIWSIDKEMSATEKDLEIT